MVRIIFFHNIKGTKRRERWQVGCAEAFCEHFLRYRKKYYTKKILNLCDEYHVLSFYIRICCILFTQKSSKSHTLFLKFESSKST